MQSHAIWSGVIGGAIAFGLNFWLARRRASGTAPRAADGWHYLRYSAGYRAVAAVSALIALFLLIAASRARPDQVVAARLVATCLTAGALYMLYEMFLRQLRFNAREIQSVHPFFTRRIAFADVAERTYLRGLDCVRIVAEDGSRMHVPLLVSTPLLSRYVRRLERRSLLARMFDPVVVNPDVVCPGWHSETEVAEALAARLALRNVGREVVTIDAANVWDVAPGESHGLWHCVFVLEGEARLRFAKHAWRLSEGQCVRIAPGLQGPISMEPAETDGLVRLIVLTGDLPPAAAMPQ
jgi:hypothetical protein